MNKVILIGNLTRDPEMKTTTNNQHITTLGIATNREWVTKDGRKQQSAEFHELVCWGRLAEFTHQYLRKGKLIYAEGHLKTRSWDDDAGVKRFRTEVVVEDLIILEKREKNGDTMPASEVAASLEEEMQPSVSMEDSLAI